MLGYNRTIRRTKINVLINIGPGAGGGRKRTGKKDNLPNTFDDDCRYKMQTRNYGVSIKHGLQTVYIKTALSSPVVAGEVGEATTEKFRHRRGE